MVATSSESRALSCSGQERWNFWTGDRRGEFICGANRVCGWAVGIAEAGGMTVCEVAQVDNLPKLHDREIKGEEEDCKVMMPVKYALLQSMKIAQFPRIKPANWQCGVSSYTTLLHMVCMSRN